MRLASIRVDYADATYSSNEPVKPASPGQPAQVALARLTEVWNSRTCEASALRASAQATHERLGGPGHWLLALAPHLVAGVQVLLRSLAAGTRPVAGNCSTRIDC